MRAEIVSAAPTIFVWSTEDSVNQGRGFAGTIRRRSSASMPPFTRECPAFISTTAKARGERAIRHGLTSRTTLSTLPRRSTNATSMANRMKNVWMPEHGAMTRAVEWSRLSRPRRPRRRSLLVPATSTADATIAPVRSLTSENGEPAGATAHSSRSRSRDPAAGVDGFADMSRANSRSEPAFVAC
jgi:hypothetical protein